MKIRKYLKLRKELIEQKSVEMIQWKGDNLKEVIAFVGKCDRFNEWFKTWEEYEKYVHEHNNIVKLFNKDGSHYEVPKGAWIVKTPDGYNVASRSKFIQKPIEWSEEDEKMLQSIIKDSKDGKVSTFSQEQWLKSLKPNHWKPSEQNIKDLEWCANLVKDKMGVGFHRLQVFIDELKNFNYDKRN